MSRSFGHAHSFHAAPPQRKARNIIHPYDEGESSRVALGFSSASSSHCPGVGVCESLSDCESEGEEPEPQGRAGDNALSSG